MRAMIARTSWCAAILALLCAPAVFAQGWPLAASADGPCNSACPDPSKKIAGYGDVFAAFTGRFLDGHDMVDLQQPFRTALIPANVMHAAPIGGASLIVPKGNSPARQQAAWTLIN